MNMDVLIRPLAATDSFEELTELLHRAYAPLAARGLAFVATHQGADVTEERCARGETWVGELGGRLVATVTLLPPGTGKPPPPGKGGQTLARKDVCVFEQFAVDPALKGQGLGKRLMTHVEERARELGATRMALDTSEKATDLIGMYSARGYRIVEPVDWRPQTNYRSVVMTKQLVP